MCTRWIAAMAILSGSILQAAAPGDSTRKPSPPTSIKHGASNIDPAYFQTGILTLQDRIWAQTQIERVYYNHRIWPKENPGPKPPFEQMVPAALIEKKATDVLRMGAALKQYWNVEITPPMLQAELDRMERESRDRATLHELFAALRNDPFLIAETLARSNLTEKAIRHHYAWDPKLHAVKRRFAAEIATQFKRSIDWSLLNVNYSRRRIRLYDDSADELGRALIGERVNDLRMTAEEILNLRKRLDRYGPGDLQEDETGWFLERLAADDADDFEVESLLIPKRTFDDWFLEMASNFTLESSRFIVLRKTFALHQPNSMSEAGCDDWTPTSISTNVPAARNHHTSIWTGSEMIVWGGRTTSSNIFNTGGRYTPSTDTWIVTSLDANVPVARSHHKSIWTGSEMIIWGGIGMSGVYLNSGGRYNPTTNGWQPISSAANTPAERIFHTLIWTGGEMIVWGGVGESSVFFNSGGRYSPATDSWTPTSLGANVPATRWVHTAIWTGSEMIVWGGFNAGDGVLNSGGRYFPMTDSWVPTSIGVNVPAGRYVHTAVWTGSEMIVWGGSNDSVGLNSGGRYNPATDTWMQTSNLYAPAARYRATAIWTGSEMIIWGGSLCDGICTTIYYNSGGRYNPAADSWISTSIGLNAPVGRDWHTSVWLGGVMIIWGGRYSNNSYRNDGAIYTSGSVPSPGASLRGGKAPGSIRFNWSSVNGAGSYNVKRCNAFVDGCIPGTIVSTPTIPQYGEANNPTSFFYAVEAVNQCGATP